MLKAGKAPPEIAEALGCSGQQVYQVLKPGEARAAQAARTRARDELRLEQAWKSKKARAAQAAKVRNEKKRFVVSMLNGGATLKEIAHAMGLSNQRVTQILGSGRGKQKWLARVRRKAAARNELLRERYLQVGNVPLWRAAQLLGVWPARLSAAGVRSTYRQPTSDRLRRILDAYERGDPVKSIAAAERTTENSIIASICKARKRGLTTVRRRAQI
jgi:hypothetical protein